MSYSGTLEKSPSSILVGVHIKRAELKKKRYGPCLGANIIVCKTGSTVIRFIFNSNYSIRARSDVSARCDEIQEVCYCSTESEL